MSLDDFKEIRTVQIRKEKEEKEAIARVQNLKTLEQMLETRPFDMVFALKHTNFEKRNEESPCGMCLRRIVNDALVAYFMERVNEYIKENKKEYGITLTEAKSTRTYRDIRSKCGSIKFDPDEYCRRNDVLGACVAELNEKRLRAKKASFDEEFMRRCFKKREQRCLLQKKEYMAFIGTIMLDTPDLNEDEWTDLIEKMYGAPCPLYKPSKTEGMFCCSRCGDDSRQFSARGLFDHTRAKHRDALEDVAAMLGIA